MRRFSSTTLPANAKHAAGDGCQHVGNFFARAERERLNERDYYPDE